MKRGSSSGRAETSTLREVELEEEKDVFLDFMQRNNGVKGAGARAESSLSATILINNFSTRGFMLCETIRHLDNETDSPALIGPQALLQM